MTINETKLESWKRVPNRTELKRIITLTLSTQEDNDTEPYFRGFFTI